MSDRLHAKHNSLFILLEHPMPTTFLRYFRPSEGRRVPGGSTTRNPLPAPCALRSLPAAECSSRRAAGGRRRAARGRAEDALEIKLARQQETATLQAVVIGLRECALSR